MPSRSPDNVMLPRERVLAVLAGQIPDRVPYYETGVGSELLRKMGVVPGDPADQVAISDALGRDMIAYYGPLQPPWNCEVIQAVGAAPGYAGKIKSRADLAKLDLGRKDPAGLARHAREFNARKGDYASCGISTLGLSTMILSMGYESFCYNLADDPAFVEELLDRFVDDCVWRIEVGNECGFDLYQVQEDIAFKTAPYVSPQWFAEVAMPRLKRAAKAMGKPWIYHSDGNITPLLPYIVELGAAGINPIEPAAMDLAATKQQYGRRLVLTGNVDLAVLETGTPPEVWAEVERCMDAAKSGGRYMISSSNSITDAAQPQNVRAMKAAIAELGRYA